MRRSPSPPSAVGPTSAPERSWDTDGVPFLESHGFTDAGQHVYAIRRLDLHHGGTHWARLHEEAAAVATDYELLHVVGATPDELLDGMVALHEAINDAPADEGSEPDVWDVDRLRAYDETMARRRQTTYRVLARHLASGELAGMSLLCVDEFSPAIAAQEDTNVVREHRGHRLGLLMKVDMVQWIADVRPDAGRNRDVERHRQPPHDRRQRAPRLPGDRSAGRLPPNPVSPFPGCSAGVRVLMSTNRRVIVAATPYSGVGDPHRRLALPTLGRRRLPDARGRRHLARPGLPPPPLRRLVAAAARRHHGGRREPARLDAHPARPGLAGRPGDRDHPAFARLARRPR